MSGFVNNLFDDLKRKHLWPVALVLLVALIAVPLLLSKPGDGGESTVSTPPPATTTAETTSVANTEMIVDEAAPFPEETKKVRKFARKDPFTSQVKPQVQSAGDAGTPTSTTGTDSTTTGSTTTPTSGTGGDTGGSTGGGVTYYRFVAKVRFGEDGSKQKNYNLTTLRSLPNAKNPVLVFMGVSNNGKTAVFLLSSSATTTGDGRCSPSDSECTFIYMKPGDAQTVETVSADGEVRTYIMNLAQIDFKKFTPKSSKSNQGSKSANGSPASSRSVGADRRAIERRKAKRQRVKRDQRIGAVMDGLGF